MTKAAYPTIGIAAFVMFVIVYFIGWLQFFHLVKHQHGNMLGVTQPTFVGNSKFSLFPPSWRSRRLVLTELLYNCVHTCFLNYKVFIYSTKLSLSIIFSFKRNERTFSIHSIGRIMYIEHCLLPVSCIIHGIPGNLFTKWGVTNGRTLQRGSISL